MSNGHPTREEDFDLYALGALDGDEKRAFESHVTTCATCSAQLAKAQGRMALLALAAPQVRPSPGVKEQLMRQIVGSSFRSLVGCIPMSADLFLRSSTRED